MNRSNPFRFDLRNGIRFIAKKFLVLPLLVSLVCFEFMLRLRETASLNHQYAGAQPTLGDFAMYLFGGMKPYIPNPDEPFLFPVSWFLVFGICLFLTLYYPVYDRDTFGKMVIVYSGSRTKWWTAKCAWIIVATFLYFFLCWILLLINCLLYGGQFTLSVSPYMSDIFLLRETIPPDQWNVCHVLLLMPPLIASSSTMHSAFAAMKYWWMGFPFPPESYTRLLCPSFVCSLGDIASETLIFTEGVVPYGFIAKNRN